MGLRSSSLAKKNDDTLTWVLHRRDFCQQDSSQKPHETKSYRGSTPSEYRGRRHNNHVQRKRRNHVHSNILDYGKPDQTYGYGISDLDDFLSKSSIGRPGNIPMVLCTGCLLYQTQLDDHYQTEVALPLGMVVNAVFKNEQWLYVQTPHAEEGYIPYGSCLPLGIVPPPEAARAPCWETQSDVFPRPVGPFGSRRATGEASSAAVATFTTTMTTTTTTMTTKTWPRCCSSGVARAADGSCTSLRRRRRCRHRRRRSGDPLPPPLGPSPDTDTCDGDDRIYYVNVFIIVIRHSSRSKSQWRQNRGPATGSGVKARKW
ncbi:hypothetical protein AGLY_001604 [Aphis glycines]|uniref:SH3 domain-containing protein n=1 Tax=Aphis glycines TaxID=307491 RepID=A0A6G0U5M8_APHGL|nr:hypothetical protein AGLY_001604 [Aphis glycines]